MKRGKREALPDTPLGRVLEKIEQVKASTRAEVEHALHVLKNLFMHRKSQYRGLAKNEAQLFSQFGLSNLVRAGRRLMAARTQGAS